MTVVLDNEEPQGNTATHQTKLPTAQHAGPVANPYCKTQRLEGGQGLASNAERSAPASAPTLPLIPAQQEYIEANKRRALEIQASRCEGQQNPGNGLTMEATRTWSSSGKLPSANASSNHAAQSTVQGSVRIAHPRNKHGGSLHPSFNQLPDDNHKKTLKHQLDDQDPGTPVKRRKVEPAAQNNQFMDGDILIGEEDCMNNRVQFRTREQHSQFPPHLVLTPDSLDTKLVLIKTASGAYLPKCHYFKTMEVDTSKDQQRQDTERTAKFNMRMDELGLTHNSFAEINPQKLTTAQSKYETPGGMRTQRFNFKSPKEAGQFTPDVLICKEDRTYVAVWPKMEGWTTLGDAEKLHARQNIMVKATGNAYVPVDMINLQRGPMAAEKLFAQFTDTQLHLERTDMKAAYYRIDEGTYVSSAEYRNRRTKPEHQGTLEPDMSKTDVLFQGPSGHSLVTSAGLKLVDKLGYQITFQRERLPEHLRTRTRNHEPRPEVLVRLNDDILVSGTRACELANGAALDAIYDAKDIYIQNKSNNGRFTGNYSDKNATQRRGPRNDVRERLAHLGITFEPYVQHQVQDAVVCIDPGVPAAQEDT